MENNKILKALGIEPINYEQENKNNMAFWFPLLKMIKMRVPKTILIHTGNCDLSNMVDGRRVEGIELFLDRMETAIEEIGLPCFIRSGMTSNKHDWKNSCYFDGPSNALLSHIYTIVQHSFMANIVGLPLDYSLWAVREIIPTKTIFIDFNHMPITKERRLFIDKGEVICNHPYWPRDCFKLEHTEQEFNELQSITTHEEGELKLMAEYVGKYFTGFWSVDFLQDTAYNWWLIDMAVGERSYHYLDCRIEREVK